MMSRNDCEGMVKGRVNAMMRSTSDIASSGQRIPGIITNEIKYVNQTNTQILRSSRYSYVPSLRVLAKTQRSKRINYSTSGGDEGTLFLP